MIGSRATRHALVALLTLSMPVRAQEARRDSIPLPEHPRPDFERSQWVNLNGRWDFAFDPRDEGERGGWSAGQLPNARPILVPFSWGAPLSGVPDSAEIGWYARSITIPEQWRGRRVFLVTPRAPEQSAVGSLPPGTAHLLEVRNGRWLYSNIGRRDLSNVGRRGP